MPPPCEQDPTLDVAVLDTFDGALEIKVPKVCDDTFDDTVDGSEIPFPTTWDVQNPCK